MFCNVPLCYVQFNFPKTQSSTTLEGLGLVTSDELVMLTNSLQFNLYRVAAFNLSAVTELYWQSSVGTQDQNKVLQAKTKVHWQTWREKFVQHLLLHMASGTHVSLFLNTGVVCQLEIGSGSNHIPIACPGGKSRSHKFCSTHSPKIFIYKQPNSLLLAILSLRTRRPTLSCHPATYSTGVFTHHFLIV